MRESHAWTERVGSGRDGAWSDWGSDLGFGCRGIGTHPLHSNAYLKLNIGESSSTPPPPFFILPAATGALPTDLFHYWKGNLRIFMLCCPPAFLPPVEFMMPTVLRHYISLRHKKNQCFTGCYWVIRNLMAILVHKRLLVGIELLGSELCPYSTGRQAPDVAVTNPTRSG